MSSVNPGAQAVTIFPLVYMPILARTIKILAMWKSERGTTLGFLEQLLASRSLFGAVQILWLLRVFNAAGVALVVLAIVSPLGSQSSLQILKIKDRPNLSQLQVAYLSTGRESYSQFTSQTYYQYALGSMDNMYAGALSAPSSVKNSTVDLWGNVKIPCLSRLVATSLVDDPDGWRTVSPEPDYRKYSSLIGIPVLGLPAIGNTSFTMETNYQELNCDRITREGGRDVPQVAEPFSSSVDIPPNGTFWGTPSNDLYGSFIAVDGLRGFVSHLDNIWKSYEYLNTAESKNMSINITYPQRTLLFRTLGLDSATQKARYTNTYCRVSTAYVEALINCTGNLCQTTKMRPSRQPNLPHPNLTPFEFGFWMKPFSTSFPLAGGGPSPLASSLTEFYLHSPTNTLPNRPRTMVDLYPLSHEDMSIRLGQVLNSYVLTSLSPWSLNSLLEDDGSLEEGDRTRTSTGPVEGSVATTSLVSVNVVTYACQWGWWAVYVFSCIVMLAIACTGAVLQRGSVGPDILGYVSSVVVQGSPYVHVPPGGTALDGASRSRLLKNLEVQLQDVESKREIGKLAFASLQGEPHPLVIDRLYE